MQLVGAGSPATRGVDPVDDVGLGRLDLAVVVDAVVGPVEHRVAGRAAALDVHVGEHLVDDVVAHPLEHEERRLGGPLPGGRARHDVGPRRDVARVVGDDLVDGLAEGLQHLAVALVGDDLALVEPGRREHLGPVGIGVRRLRAREAHDHEPERVGQRRGGGEHGLDLGGRCAGDHACEVEVGRVLGCDLTGEQRGLAALRVPEHDGVVRRLGLRDPLRGAHHVERADGPRSRPRGTGARPACRGPRSRWRPPRTPVRSDP